MFKTCFDVIGQLMHCHCLKICLEEKTHIAVTLCARVCVWNIISGFEKAINILLIFLSAVRRENECSWSQVFCITSARRSKYVLTFDPSVYILNFLTSVEEILIYCHNVKTLHHIICIKYQTENVFEFHIFVHYTSSSWLRWI